MKRNPRQGLYRGLEQLSLPTQVIGDSYMELQGDRQILLSGQKGIRSYETNEIVVELNRCAVRILGNDLGLVTMTDRELLIRGVIDSVGFIR